MLNGNTIQGKVQQGGFIKKLLDAKKQPGDIIESIYVRCLSRLPTTEESGRLLSVVKESANLQQGLEDVFWAVLNSREFLFNH